MSEKNSYDILIIVHLSFCSITPYEICSLFLSWSTFASQR